MENFVSEVSEVKATIGKEDVVISIGKLTLGDVISVSNDVSAIVDKWTKGEQVNIIEVFDKVLRLVVTVKDSKGKDHSADIIPVDTLGEVVQEAYNVNFTAAHGSWTPLIDQVKKDWAKSQDKDKA